MENVEYLKSETRKLLDALDAAHEHLQKIQDIPKARIKRELNRPGLDPAEVGGTIGVIEWSRSAAIARMGDLRGEAESLYAALDDAIGKVGRLV